MIREYGSVSIPQVKYAFIYVLVGLEKAEGSWVDWVSLVPKWVEYIVWLLNWLLQTQWNI